MASHHQSANNSGFVPRRSNPTTIRSSASGSNSSHVYGGGRPRSLSLYSPSSSPSSSSTGSYGGLLGHHSSIGGYGSSSPYLGGHSGYSSPSYGSPSSVSTYGGTSSGYGGLTLHRATSSSSLGLSSSPRSSYYNSFLQTPSNSVYSGSGVGSSSKTLPGRSSSFNRVLNNARSSPLSSALGSRSGSLTSLASIRSCGSEGYSSGGDISSHSSRLSSTFTPAGGDSRAVTPAYSAKDGSENGELDYKKLYEESLAENERLREKLKKTEDDLNERKSQLEKLSVSTAKNSLSELEKRERRAMERKLSEMEEELKQLQKLKAENERLKAENRALTRVVSKLTNSANATK